jgi:DNA polymerase III subunit gamma/tau
MPAAASPDPGGDGNLAGSANAGAADPPAGPVGAAHPRAGPAGAGGRPARRRPPKTAPAPSRAAAPADEPWPDDASGPDAALTGMELIARQLGGQVIEEIDEG